MKNMSKLMALVLVGVMLVLSTACAMAETMTATADGFGGAVSVTVTVEDGKITNVTAEGANETPGIGSKAIEELPAKIVEAQSADIDTVAGATVTSKALLSAADAAIGQATGAAASGYAAGTYTQNVKGRNAAMTIEVVLGETAIESVKVLEHTETMDIAAVALERIPAQIVEKQTTKVDAVTGATVTSNAIKQAVNDAITAAGGNPATLPEGYAQPQADVEKTADVIVVGGGGAGMAAAISARQAGASVIMIEKTSMLGGNTVVCGGAIGASDTEWAANFAAQTGEDAALEAITSLDESLIAPEYLNDYHTLQAQVKEYLAGERTQLFDSVELHTIQTYYYGLRTSLTGETIYGDYDLVSTMTRNAMPVVNWLGELGVQWQNAATQPTGAMWRRGHNPTMMHGEEYVAVLGSKITELGGEIMCETAATELTVDENGKVNGVIAKMSDGTKVTLHANKAVILATGGYANNVKMVQETNEYWETISDTIGTTNASGMTGDGIVMAQAIGADTTGMGFTQVFPLSDPDNGDLFTGVLPQATANYLLVNTNGKRFVNECEARDTLAKAVFANGGLCFLIGDSKHAENSRWLTNWEVEVERGNALMADTLEELADKMGLSAEAKANFLAEVVKYNETVDVGFDPEFNKTAFDMKIEDGPYYATPRSPSLHHTMGGLKINASTEVLKANGEAIPGLYAAGEVCGGIHAGNRLGGNAVADCFVFGKIAGENAAK